MLGNISIIMYHYVRDLKKSRFPGIKGLDIKLFHEQILYLNKHYHIINPDDLIDAIENDCELPHNAALLTFDDAYIDHFTQAFPILDRYSIKACFFPPAIVSKESIVLDVNKIHFLLASVSDKTKLVKYISKSIDDYSTEYNLKDKSFYWNTVAIADQHDPPDVIYIKRMLQVILPNALRKELTNKLFKEYVTSDETSFSKELYMDMEQLKCMHRNGMHIGGHGHKHDWLGRLSDIEQEEEINLTVDFLKEINGSLTKWIMSYPFSSYNDTTLRLLRNKKCTVGLTTHINIANYKNDNPLLLPRLDTNNIPKASDAKPNEWTIKHTL